MHQYTQILILFSILFDSACSELKEWHGKRIDEITENQQTKQVKSIFLQKLGLSPSSQYRVTVRAKNSRASGQTHQIAPAEEAPGAYTDFRTLTKGLPDPPQVGRRNKLDNKQEEN